jgi:hypothetical protein
VDPFKVGDYVEIHGLDRSSFSKYDQTFNGLKGYITSFVECDCVRVRFFKGQRRACGEFSDEFIRHMSALDVVAFECFKEVAAE